MKNAWVLDVLTDMQKFAQKNEMALLATKLDEAKRAAAIELNGQLKSENGAVVDYCCSSMRVTHGPTRS